MMNFKELNLKILNNYQKGNFREAYKDLINIFKIKKESATANRLGVIFTKLNKKKFAEYFYLQSIEIDKNNYDSHYNLGIYYQDKNIIKSEKHTDIALSLKDTIDAKLLKSNILLQKFNYNQILNLLIGENDPNAFYFIGLCYLALNKLEKSQTYFQKAISSKSIYLNFLYLNTFPRIYSKQKDIIYFRKKYKIQLDNLLTLIKKTTNTSLDTLTIPSNFYLSYQQKNDLCLNKKYYKVLNNINKANQVLITKCKKNKIAFISSFFYCHTVSKLFYNFVKEFSLLKNYDVHLLHTGNKSDDWTQKYLDLKIKYTCLTDIRNIHNFLINEKFETIFFLDHSMSNITQNILIKKYAKIYFMFWGHPVTTGCKNVDYFISSDYMDKGNQDHYSEKLILLEKKGFNYELDENIKNVKIDETNIDNSFAIIQSLFKLIPKYDYIYAKILSETNNTKIYFIEDKDTEYNNRFQDRLKNNKYLKKNFHRINFLKRMSQKNFYTYLSKFKIILDSIGWSGGNTTMEALYLNKPIITLLGKNLRSNHSAAILRELGLDILVAKNYSEYISLSKKIINDKKFYNEIVSYIKNNKSKVFNNNVKLYSSVKNLI